MGSYLSLALGKKKPNDMIIPEELVVEILMRLPAKSLMRFKCVSTEWLSLITSRYLTNLFFKSFSSRQRSVAYFMEITNTKNYALLALSARDYSGISVPVIDQVPTFPGMRGNFVSLVRGLACFTFENRVRVCNVTTRQVVELPVMRSKAKGNNIHEMHYFGHDPVHDRYKVLRVVFDISKKSSKLQVFVLGAGPAWRKIQCHIPHDPSRQGMTINGVLYYEASSGGSNVLMSFDLETEELKLIELPNMVRTAKFSMTSLMNYKGKIAVFGSMNKGIVDVRVLEDAEKSQWSNKKTFVMPPQMDVVRGNQVAMRSTSHSGKIWLAKGLDKPNFINDRFALHLFIYDLERKEIAQRIIITTSEISRALRAIGRTQVLVKPTWSLLTFWNGSESIMYLEI